jgi:hypothetical protein
MEGKKLVIVLAQESKHIVSSCWGKQRCIFVERNHVGIGAVEKNMLLILDIISKSKSESLYWKLEVTSVH